MKYGRALEFPNGSLRQNYQSPEPDQGFEVSDLWQTVFGIHGGQFFNGNHVFTIVVFHYNDLQGYFTLGVEKVLQQCRTLQSEMKK